jgi:glucose/arabinose dehydrogenase
VGEREGELLIALQDGRIVSVLNSESTPAARTILDIREQVSRDGNEEGLLGMAIANGEIGGAAGRIFVYYSVEDRPRRTRLARMDWTRVDGRMAIDASTELVLLEVPQPFSNHNGGKIAFGPDGMLYVALGDGGSGGDPQGNGQNIGTLLGSILRLDVSAASAAEPYRIPADNPFAAVANARGEIWAYGLRNPWRFSFDTTGRLWAGDVGQGQFEEIDLIERGGNYGWNVVEGRDCYQGDTCDPSSYIAPVSVYDHDLDDCSVTGGVVHAAKDSEALQGWYFFADFCTGRVRAFHPDAQPIATHVLIDSGPPISAIAQISRGVLMLSFDGRIYRLAEAE